LVPDMSVRVFSNNKWQVVKLAYMYHEGIGFVTMSSIRCFANGEWQVVSIGEKELVGI
jgi:hypothetical protein